MLIAVRTTPSLWTKTNKILASLTIADLLTGLTTVLYTVYSFKAFVYGIPCDYEVLGTAIFPTFTLGPYASFYSLTMVVVDRYVAIAHPFVYNEKMTGKTVNFMILGAWLAAAAVSATYWFWLIDRDKRKCTTFPQLIPDKYSILETAQNILVALIIIVLYAKMLVIARRHHLQIRSQEIVLAPTRTAAKKHNLSTEACDLADLRLEEERQQREEKHLQEEINRQRMKQRRREFKAFYLTAVIIGAFFVLWIPHKVGGLLQWSGCTQPFVSVLANVGEALGMLNSSFNWIIYGAVNKTYRKAFKRLLAP